MYVYVIYTLEISVSQNFLFMNKIIKRKKKKNIAEIA